MQERQAHQSEQLTEAVRVEERLHLVGAFPGMDSRIALAMQAANLAGLLTIFSDGRVRDPADIAVPGDRSPAAEDGAYAPWRCASLAAFADLKRRGLIPKNARLQTSLPVAIQYAHGLGRLRRDRDDYANALCAHVAGLVAEMQADEAAIQLELPYADLSETVRETTEDLAEDARATFVEEALRVIDQVPAHARLALHLDCRDGARFAMTPADAVAMAGIAQDLLARASRPIDLLHIPIPLRHETDEFFRGLAPLQLPPDTTLCLGLIHLSDGRDGALRRIDLARPHLPDFAVAARSGFAARPPEAIGPFLQLHAHVARDIAA